MLDVHDVYAVTRDAAILLNQAGAAYAPVFIRVSNHYKSMMDQSDFTLSDTDTLFTRSIEDVLLQTQNILSSARVGKTYLDAFMPYWKDIPTLWARRRVRLDAIWEDLVILAGDIAEDTLDATLPEFVLVHAKPATEEFVQAIQYLSSFEPNLRLMFIESDTPDELWTADILDEDGLDVLLSSYPHTKWVGSVDLGSGEHQYTVEEFQVYQIGGYRIFRSGGYLVSCNKAALEALKSGEFLPRMATVKTGSVLRVTFSQRAMTDHAFRDFLRSLGGAQKSHSSWDIPIYEENDVEQTLDKIKHQFGYPVTIYQIVDHPKHDIYAYNNPIAQVVRMLSADVVAIQTDIDVTPPDLSELSTIDAAVEKLQGEQRHLVERVAAACRIKGHYVVACPGEIKPRIGQVCQDVHALFGAARTEMEPAEVVIIPGSVTKIVTADIVINTETVVIHENSDQEVDLGDEHNDPKMVLPMPADNVMDFSETSVEEDTVDFSDTHDLIMASVKMDKKDRAKINEALGAAGFDGNKTFDKVGSAISDIQALLWKHGFDIEPQINSNFQKAGTVSLIVREKGDDGAELSNTVLFVQWAPRGDTEGFEVISYLG